MTHAEGIIERILDHVVPVLVLAPMVHIGGWARDYPTIECYLWGNKPDVPCPKKYKNDAERMRLARAEKKESV